MTVCNLCLRDTDDPILGLCRPCWRGESPEAQAAVEDVDVLGLHDN